MLSGVTSILCNERARNPFQALVPKLGCKRAATRTSAVVLWLLFVLFLTILRRIHSDIFESGVKRRQNGFDNVFVLNREKRL